MKRFCLPKTKRLTSNEQFKAVMACHRRFSDGLLILYVAENDCGYSRLGVSVGKSFGPAVVRNRLKRLLREAFRQSQDGIPAGFDYLLFFSPQWLEKFDKSTPSKKPIKKLNLQQVRSSFLKLVDIASAGTRPCGSGP